MTEWTYDFPVIGGWYFWRRSTKSNDPFHWFALFIEDGAVWECGTQIEKPKGGQWLKVTMPETEKHNGR